MRLIPDRFVAHMSKRKRKGKIYVDYLCNARGTTVVAALSTRARIVAPVSIPLTWEELSADIRLDHFTVSNVPERLQKSKQDPWRGYFTVKQHSHERRWPRFECLNRRGLGTSRNRLEQACHDARAISREPLGIRL